MTHVSIATFWTIFSPIALAVIGVLGTWLTNTLAAKLKFNKGSQALDDFDQAMAHGISLLEDTLASIANHNSVLTVPSALEQAAKLVLTLAPGAVSALGITPESVAALLASRLPATPAAQVAALPPAQHPAAKISNPATV